MWDNLGQALNLKHQMPFSVIKHIMQTVIIPTLLSGLQALCLSAKHLINIDNCVKDMWRRFFSLGENSAINPLLWMIGLPLPSTTWILNVLSLFHNIWITDSPCKVMCIYILKNNVKGFNWINMVEKICKKYGLPHPYFLLNSSPPKKEAWKKHCKLKVLQKANEEMSSLI